ncbi:MAG: hypothetical protein GX631_09785 [Dehalococcoidales bacterium]|nr:hypothetical protein [Dehalococcoidales bacterium]
MNSSVILSVGEAFHLKTGKDWILYGGMPSDDVFSVIQKKQNGYQGYAWNLFFSRKQTEITVDGVPLYVESVSPQEIRIRVR